MGSLEVLYFLNDPAGQRAVGMVERGEVEISGATIREGVVGGAPEPKPSIFTLYEENIGLVTPLLADQMVDAEASYPWAWVEEAFKLAVGRKQAELELHSRDSQAVGRGRKGRWRVWATY